MKFDEHLSRRVSDVIRQTLSNEISAQVSRAEVGDSVKIEIIISLGKASMEAAKGEK